MPITRCRSLARATQSRPAASNAWFSRSSAVRKVVFQSASNWSRAGPTQVVPCSVVVTVLITEVMVSIWRCRLWPSAVSCSGLAPNMVMVILLGDESLWHDCPQ